MDDDMKRFLKISIDISFYINKNFALSLCDWSRQNPEEWLTKNPNYQKMMETTPTTTSVPAYKNSDWALTLNHRIKPGEFERLPYVGVQGESIS